MSDNPGCQVCVTGSLGDLSEEVLELFFESKRFCPNGGDVEGIHWLNTGSVLVKFRDCKVVNRLEKNLVMPSGIKLRIEPFVDSNDNDDDEDGKISAEVKTPITEKRTVCERIRNDKSIPEVNSSFSSDDEEESTQFQSKKLSCGSNFSINSAGSNCTNIGKVDTTKRSIRNLGFISQASSSSGFDSSSSSSSSSSSCRRGHDVNFPVRLQSFTNEKKSNSNNSLLADLNKTYDTRESNALSKTTSPVFPGNKSNVCDWTKYRSGSQSFKSQPEFGWPDDSKNEDHIIGRKYELEESRREVTNPLTKKPCEKRVDYKSEGRLCSKLSSSDESFNFLENDGLRGRTHFDENEKDSVHSPASVPDFSSSAVKKTEKLSFSVEKLKLIRLVLELKDKDNIFISDCNLKFDEFGQTVTIEGSNDDVMCVKVRLHEIVLHAASGTVNISKQAQKLLLCAKGEEWLARQFRQQCLSAVFYIKDGKSYVMARDDDMLQSSCDLLSQVLIDKHLPFDDSTQSFLQSLIWARKVEEVESSCLVAIDTDYSQKQVKVTGCKTDVTDCMSEFQKLLKKNNTVTRSVRHKKGVVRLLKSQMHDITEQVNKARSSMVQLKFDDHKSAILVSGLQDDVEEAINFIDANYVKVICYDQYQVNMQGLTLELFTSKNRPGSDLIDLLELRNKCIIEVRGDPARTSTALGNIASRTVRPVASVQMRPAKEKSSNIQVHQGSIADYKADVLVNTIASRSVERGGVINQCFLKAGGARLYQELRQSVPQDFGYDVVITSASGRLDAKLIFHAAIRKYRNRDSIDRLYNLIKKCLEMAVKNGMNSIAFPTIGCGKLGYNPKDVSDCFSQAMKSTHTNLQISIIAFEDHLLQDFRSNLTRDLPASFSDRERGDSFAFGGKIRRFFGSLYHQKEMPVNKTIVFHINALSKDVVQHVKQTLVSKINEMVTESPIKDEAIGELSDEAISKIENLRSSDVDIILDKAKCRIVVKGMKSDVDDVRMKVLQLIYQAASQNERPRSFQRQNSFQIPRHWDRSQHGKQHSASSKGICRELSLSANKEIFDEVSSLIMGTWESNKVGHGSDAAGLGRHSIRILKISSIENHALFRKYMSRREEFCLEASVNPCQCVKGMLGEQEIKTLQIGLKTLDAVLARGVNECYLLHGTKGEVVSSISNTGVDSRLSGQSVLFGPGAYFTESSTKADQYADTKNKRLPNGRSLYMYVCRVLLGRTFVCQTPKPFKRPPCMKSGCYSDACNHEFVGTFDSVIGTHKPGNVRLLFREFVIYHPEQSYPEFLVEYVRT